MDKHEKRGLRFSLTDAGISPEEAELWQAPLEAAKAKLAAEPEDFKGWVQLPFSYDEEELKALLEAAGRIQQQCEALIVIGIGGSYLGARAGAEFLSHSFAGQLPCSEESPAPKLYFAGQNISGTYHGELLEIIEEQEICLCVISKSGTTTEPSIAFALLKEALYRKYGEEEGRRRIYAITDKSRGVLREEADRQGYTTFVVPDDIGGRYSVLTPVGLLPLAAAGFDVKAMLEGAAAVAKGPLLQACGDYAAARNILLDRGKLLEIYECYEPRLAFFTEWLKQLFGESEGKDGKGIFPASLQFTADLHSMGQFLQEGNQIFFETVLHVVAPEKDLLVPEGAGPLLAGRSVNAVNLAAVEGVAAAHRAAGIPQIRLDIPAMDAYSFGQMVYFFETACALSAYLLGVNPFNQPGVEQYKKEMRAVLAEKKEEI